MASKEIATTSWYTDASLKAYYRFSTGDLTTDSSGEGHTLTDIGDPAEVDGVFGKAADFDADDAYSATDHDDFKPTGAFTIGLWIKKNTGGSVFVFQSYSNSGTVFSGIYLYVTSTGEIQLVSGKNSGNVQGTDFQLVKSTTKINDNAWHFVVSTWDGSHLRMYVDGLSNATAVAWANAPVYAATNYVRIGCRCLVGTNAQFLTGQLDDVFLLNGTALTGEQINHIYTGINIKKINGLSNYGLKSSNGLAKASIKSFNSL
jgi:hypothetical protein